MTDDFFHPDRVDDVGDQEPVIDRSGENTRAARLNPRLVFVNPDDYFGRFFFQDLLMEQMEQM